MAATKLFILCVFYLAVNCEAVKYIDPCKPDDNACILASAKKAMPYFLAGDPSIGLKPLNPLKVDSVKADNGDLKLQFNDLTIEGLDKCVMINAERNLQKSTINFEVDCPFKSTGSYKANGKLSVLPVEGNGPFVVICDKYKLTAVIRVKTVDHSDGKKYWEVSRRRISGKPLKKVHLTFENLFNGDEQKAAPVKTFIDSSSNDLFELFSEEILKQILDKIIEPINKVLDRTPSSELEVA